MRPTTNFLAGLGFESGDTVMYWVGRPGPGLELASPVSVGLTEADRDTGGVTLILGLVAVRVKLVESTETPGGCWKSIESSRD